MHALRSLAFAVLAAAALPAVAHEEHGHAAKHGGILADSGHHHLEIVAKDGVLEVHISGEHGLPEIVSQAKATAAVLSEGKKVDVTLTPDGETALKGTGAFKAAKGTVIVLTLKMPQHDPEQVRVKLD